YGGHNAQPWVRVLAGLAQLVFLALLIAPAALFFWLTSPTEWDAPLGGDMTATLALAARSTLPTAALAALVFLAGGIASVHLLAPHALAAFPRTLARRAVTALMLWGLALLSLAL